MCGILLWTKSFVGSTFLEQLQRVVILSVFRWFYLSFAISSLRSLIILSFYTYPNRLRLISYHRIFRSTAFSFSLALIIRLIWSFITPSIQMTKYLSLFIIMSLKKENIFLLTHDEECRSLFQSYNHSTFYT